MLKPSSNGEPNPISPNNNTVWSNRQVMRTDEMITKRWNVAGCKESHFYSFPFGKAETNIY